MSYQAQYQATKRATGVIDASVRNFPADPAHKMHLMRSSCRQAAAVLSMFFVLGLVPGPAYAYIDPNAGGMLFQLLAPVFAAAVGAWLFLRRWIAEAVRNFWHRLTRRRPE